MPTYEYECNECEHNFDEFQSITAAPLKKCPKCGKRKLRRLFGTGTAILFKGSGFYETDYRSDSYKKAAKADSDSSTKSEGKSEKGGDSKNSTPKSSPESTSSKSTAKAEK